ncbi:MAG: DUF2934 domain-containing protein [Methyloprofundus sp.]|nr:DUF2934 domain-containing protein [Methyloprofundus sp.]
MADNQGQQSSHKYGIDPDKFRAMIAGRAYYKAEQRGFATGHEMDDWLEAEKEVNKQYFYWFQDE